MKAINISPQGQPTTGHLGGIPLARRRYQKGSVYLRGKVKKVWVARWREDERLPDGTVRRINRKEVLGTLKEHPTKRLAHRALEARIAHINCLNYRPQLAITFAQFAERWKATVLPQYKQSTQRHLASDITHHLYPAFGALQLRDITTERLQAFVSSLKLGAKTAHNVVAVLRSLWRTAKAWGYVSHEVFAGIILPQVTKPEVRCFTLAEALRIIGASGEPYKTLYWLAAESGMRAGELCALLWGDVDLDKGIVHVRQSAWHGQLQSPKTAAGRRVIAISPGLAKHLCSTKSDREGLIFANRLGRPRKGEKVVERHLKPLCDKLGIPRRGLHAFRHLNGSLMDQFGAPIKVRQERLGHSSALITLDRYTHLISEDDRRIAAQLGEVLCPVVSNQASGPECVGNAAVGIQ